MSSKSTMNIEKFSLTLCNLFPFHVHSDWTVHKCKASVEQFCNKSNIFVNQNCTLHFKQTLLYSWLIWHSTEIKQQFVYIRCIFVRSVFVTGVCCIEGCVCTVAQSLCVFPPNWGTDIAVVSLTVIFLRFLCLSKWEGWLRERRASDVHPRYTFNAVNSEDTIFLWFTTFNCQWDVLCLNQQLQTILVKWRNSRIL